MATYNNPRGTVEGTADSDTFIFDIALDTRTSIDGKEAADTLIVDRSSDRRTHFSAGDYSNSGSFQGGVYYGLLYIPITEPYISFSQIENLRFTGSAGDDWFDLTVSNAASNNQVDFDGGEGHDSLSFDFGSRSLNFVVDDETITSSFGNFANIEQFSIRTGAGDDVIRTGAGADSISTGAGSDEVFAGSGNDSISTQGGGDTVDGGVGTDHWSADFSGGAGSLTVDFGSTITTSNGTTAINVEGVNFTSGSGNDQFNVTRLGTTRIQGGAGYDTLNHAIIDHVYRNYSVTGLATFAGAPSTLSGQVWTFTTNDDYTGFEGIERIVIQAGTNRSLFQLSGVFAPSAIDFDGGGLSELRATFESMTGASTFIQQADGSIVSNRGTFADFFQVWLTGAGGNDVFTTQGGDDRLNGNGGSDILSSGAAEDLLNGGDGSDSLYGGADNDELNGGTGADLLDGGSGDDAMTGGTGSDIYVVDSAGDVVNENPGEGTDEVRTSLATYVLAANVENLAATSNDAHDFRGNAGDNVVTGGAGNDILRLYDGGNDTVLAGGGNDNIFIIGSLTSADIVNGGDGNDTLILQGNYAGGLTLTANVTNIEMISILAGSNTNFGESGTGRYDYTLVVHDANFSGGIQVRVNGAALLEGEDFTFDGSAELDSRFVVYGGKGKDTLTGSRSNDIFFYAEERFATGDTVNGGAGYDGMFLRGNYTIDFNAPGYTGLFTNIENLTLTSATDERYARGGGTEFDYNLVLSDAIVKPGETLTISGALLMASETMVLDGSAELDGLLRLFGGKADDTLKGGGQSDLIHGNLGADILTGNGGADTFRFDSAADSNSGSMDQITDFTPGTDKVDLSRIDADSNTAGNQAFIWIGSDAFSGTAGQLRAYEQSGTWFVEGDTNGDSIADLVIALTLTGHMPLAQGDFLP